MNPAALRAKRFSAVLLAFSIALASSIGAPAAQELVLTTGMAPGGFPAAKPVVVFPDLGPGLPNPPRTYIVPPISPALSSQGLALLAPDRALVTQLKSSKAILLDTSTGTLIDSYDLPQPTPTTFYDGYGTLAVNPAKTHVLAVTDLDTLWVIAAPFDHTAAVTMLSLPSSAGTPQTRAIAFDSTSGRAYVALLAGIAVIDPPYTSIAFTIPSSNGLIVPILGPFTGAVALSPDNATLVATRGASGAGYGPEMRIFHAPFTAASVPDVLTISGASLDGMTFTPDGSKILVVDSVPHPSPALPKVYAVASPYSAASAVETLQFETGGAHDGFEDIDISADGQLAALSGGSGNGDPFVVLKAPFTAAGFTFTLIDVPQFDAPYGSLKGRGDGAPRFWSTSVPALPPQVWVDVASTSQSIGGGVQVTEGNSGTTDAAVAVNLSGPSALPVTIDYTTVDGTTVGLNVGATAADNDYVPASGTITFAPGETTKNIVVKVVGDTAYEHDERFNVVISNPVNASLLGTLPGFADKGTVVIKNDDAVEPIAITTTALPDGATGVPYSFQLTGTGAHPFTWTVSSFPSPLPAGLSLDAATGIISGTPTTPITLAEDIKVTDPIGLFAEKILSLTITGTGIPVLTPIPSPLDFGSRTVGTPSPIMTSFVTNTGSADLVLGTPYITPAFGFDFALASSTCTDGQTLTPGAQCQLNFRFIPQSTGTRSVTLDFNSNAAPASLTLTGVGVAAGLPVLSIAGAGSVLEGNSGTTPMSFVVTLAPASASTVTVNYATTGGTATNGVDYTLAGSGTLSFAPGATTQTIIANIIGDTQVEPDETIVISLSAPSGATLGTATATGIILNDDSSGPTLSLQSGNPDFGNQVISTTSAPHVLTVANTGGANLVLATPFAPLSGGEFAYTVGSNQCTNGLTLAPAATCLLYVEFMPSALGARSTIVTLSSNAPDVTVTLTGNGLAAAATQPIPTLTPAMLALLALALGATGLLLTRGHAKR